MRLVWCPFQVQLLSPKVKAVTEGHGANVIMEALGGEVFKQCLRRYVCTFVYLPKPPVTQNDAASDASQSNPGGFSDLIVSNAGDILFELPK